MNFIKKSLAVCIFGIFAFSLYPNVFALDGGCADNDVEEGAIYCEKEGVVEYIECYDGKELQMIGDAGVKRSSSIDTFKKDFAGEKVTEACDFVSKTASYTGGENTSMIWMYAVGVLLLLLLFFMMRRNKKEETK